MCGNRCGGAVWGAPHVSDWFSNYLGVRCWLARHVTGHHRSRSNGEHPSVRSPDVAFANEQPLLLISKDAVDRLNAVLKARNERLVTSRHFRPNLVTRLFTDSTEAHVAAGYSWEDEWTKLFLPEQNVWLSVTGPCARCHMVDIDPTSGMKGRTLRALADHRRQRGAITFGIFLRGAEGSCCSRSDDAPVWIAEGDLLVCQ